MKRLFSTVILASAILIALWFGGLMGFFGQCAAPVSKLLACGSGPNRSITGRSLARPQIQSAKLQSQWFLQKLPSRSGLLPPQNSFTPRFV